MNWKFDGLNEQCPWCGCRIAELRIVGDKNNCIIFHCSSCGETPVPESCRREHIAQAVIDYSTFAKRMNKCYVRSIDENL